MSLKPETPYDAELTDAKLTKSQKGTKGVWLQFKIGEELFSDTLWIVPSSLKYREKDMVTLGASSAEIRSAAWWAECGRYLRGAQVELVFEEDTYKDKTRLKIKYINQLRPKLQDSEIQDVVSMFGGGADVPVLTDDDVPF